MPFGEAQFEKSLPAAEKTEQAREIEFKAIASLYEPAKKILGDMRENIEAGQYVAILGDDASGRLPTLLFRKVLSAIYENKRIDPPKTLFFAGQIIREAERREKIQNDFMNFLEKAGVSKIAEGKKVLFVTDTIGSGEHLRPFMEVLRRMGINFDIVTVGIYINTPGNILDKEKRFGCKIFYGHPGTPFVYRKHDAAGVMKSEGTEDVSLFAKAIRGYFGKRKIARKDVVILAAKLIKWYHEGGEGNA